MWGGGSLCQWRFFQDLNRHHELRLATGTLNGVSTPRIIGIDQLRAMRAGKNHGITLLSSEIWRVLVESPNSFRLSRLEIRNTSGIFFSSTHDPIVQWPRTLPFHGSNTGSNPVRVATLSGDRRQANSNRRVRLPCRDQRHSLFHRETAEPAIGRIIPLGSPLYSLTCSVWRSTIRPVMRSMATLTQTRLSPATLKSEAPVPLPVNFPVWATTSIRMFQVRV